MRERFQTSKSFNYLDDIKLILKLILCPGKLIVLFKISIAFQLFNISETKTIPEIVLNHLTAIIESITVKQNRKYRVDVLIINLCLFFEHLLLNIIFESIVPFPRSCIHIVLLKDLMYNIIFLLFIFIFVSFSYVICLSDYMRNKDFLSYK